MDYWTIGILAATPFIVAAQVYFLVQKMSHPEKMLKQMPDGALSPARYQVLQGYEPWLAANHFRYVMSFQFGSIQTVVFQQDDAQRYFSVMFHALKTSFEFDSRFDDNTTLETATSGSTGMFPARPGSYKQSFPGAAIDDAWQRHLDAENYLMGKFGIKWQSLSLPLEQNIINSLRLQMEHVRSIPFYPFRALYWYAVSRQRMANRSIQQQFP